LTKNVTERLPPEQLRALLALMEHGDKAKAARSAGVSRTTLYRWLNEDAAFQAALDAATTAALREFSTTLVRLTQKAAKALEDALDDSEITRADLRLRAASIVVGKLLAFHELLNIERRLAELEATANAN
jgi:hypothetical protein